MPDYALELYVPRSRADTVDAEATRLAALAAELTAAGTRLLFKESLYLPGDEICFFVFEADSAAAVEHLGSRGALEAARVVEFATRMSKRYPKGGIHDEVG